MMEIIFFHRQSRSKQFERKLPNIKSTEIIQEKRIKDDEVSMDYRFDVGELGIKIIIKVWGIIILCYMGSSSIMGIIYQ